MYRLDANRRSFQKEVCTTLSNPIKVLDYLELKEALIGIGLIFYFGIIFTQPLLLTCLLGLLWGVWPNIRSKYERGVIVQKLYRWLGVSMKGILKPSSSGRYQV